MAAEPGPNVGTKLMLENERVRDLSLAPGESLPRHLHREDFLFIVVQGGSLEHIDDLSQEAHAVRYEDDQVVFLEAGDGVVHNRLKNVGDAPYRNFVIELKRCATEIRPKRMVFKRSSRRMSTHAAAFLLIPTQIARFLQLKRGGLILYCCTRFP